MDAHAVKVLDGRRILPFISVCDLIGILFYLVMCFVVQASWLLPWLIVLVAERLKFFKLSIRINYRSQ